MSGYVELEEFITPERVEWAHGRACNYQMIKRQSAADAAWRAAKARDPKLLKALEKGAEIIGKMSEAQMGQTRRRIDVPFSESREHTESQMWRKAYEFMDKGDPIIQLQWIYCAGALLAGLVD